MPEIPNNGRGDAPRPPQQPVNLADSPTANLLNRVQRLTAQTKQREEHGQIAPMTEAESAKYGAILGFLTGETIPAGEKPKYPSATLRTPTVVVSDNTLTFEVEEGVYDRKRIALSVPLDRPLTPSSVGLTDGWRSTKVTPLADASDEQLREASEFLATVATHRLDLQPPHNLVSIRAGEDENEEHMASYVQRKVAVALLDAAQQQYATYPNSPLAQLLPYLRDYLERPSHYLSEASARYWDTLTPQVEALAGYRDISGQLVRGELLSGRYPLAVEALNISTVRQTIAGGDAADEEVVKTAVHKLRDSLTGELLPQVEDAHRLLFPQPDNFSFERGKAPVKTTEFVDPWDDFTSTRGYSVGERDDEGRIPFTTDGEITQMRLGMTAEDFSTGVYTPSLDAGGKMTGKEASSEILRPVFYVEITEAQSTPDGQAETYKVFPVNEGILVQCEGADMPTYYHQDVLIQLRGSVTRKPVIYLYPKREMSVKVQLNYNGKLTNTYPQINGDTWRVNAASDGTLTVNGKKYKYLFWDGVNSEVEWDWSEGFSVHRDDVDTFLEQKIEELGLNFAEAQDFITYWAPMMKQNEWNLVSFQTERYEELARLIINPRPDTLLRVFMVFKKVNGSVDIKAQKLKKMKRKGFTVVEWGGSNLDEVQLTTYERDIPIRSSFLQQPILN